MVVTILVTGAASGIGAALMPMLAGEVVGLDRNAHTSILACDLADPHAIGSVAQMVDGPLMGIAHVAGLPGTWDAETVLAVNTLAPIALTENLLSKLSEGASIVTVSSVTALRCTWTASDLDSLIDMPWADALSRVAGMDGARAYELSKAAVNRWTVRMAARLQPRGIRVNTVSPGPVQTPILKDFKTSIGADRLAAAETMTGRHGLPAEISAVIAFLLSEAAQWINGADIRVDGGYHAIRAMAAS